MPCSPFYTSLASPIAARISSATSYVPRYQGSLRPWPLPTARAAEHMAPMPNRALTSKVRIVLANYDHTGLDVNMGGNEANVPFLPGWLRGLMALGSASAGPRYVKYLGSHHMGAGLTIGTERMPIR